MLYYGFSEQAMERMHMALRVSGGAHRGHNLDFFRQPLASHGNVQKGLFQYPMQSEEFSRLEEYKVGGKWTSHFT